MTEKEEEEVSKQPPVEMSNLYPARRVGFEKGLLSSSDSSEDDLVPGQNTPSDVASTNLPSHRQRSQTRDYRVYWWRWFLLAALCLLNISNGMMWLSFAPIPNYTARYYNVEVSDVDWFSIVFFLVSMFVGFVAIGILDTFGLRPSLYLGAGLNLLGSILRYLSTIDPILCSSVFSKSGYMVAMIGQFLTACAQPFLLYSPTKLASFWFGPKERAICTNFASIANPIGLAITQIASPYIVTSTDKIPMMLWIYTVPAGVAAILTVMAFWRNKPPLPPSLSSKDDSSPPFFKGLKMVVTNVSFWILLVIWGSGAGLFNALLTILPQIVCPFGYSDTAAGLWGALMIFCGLVGATLAGLLIDFTKLFKDVAVIAIAFATLCFIWFIEVFSLSRQPYLIGASLCAFGFFALPLIPACMELGVEITYPVAEATSSGLLWTAAQIMGIVLLFLGQALQFKMSPDQLGHQNDHCQATDTNDNSSLPCLPSFYSNSSDFDAGTKVTPYNFTHALYLYLGLVAGILLLIVTAFHPKYRRISAEKEEKFGESVYIQR